MRLFLAFLIAWIMTPSRTPLVSRSLRRSPAVLGPLLVRKRRHNSSSSESSSRTVKAVSRRKPPGNRPVAQAPRDKNQDKRAKKRSKLTGLTNFFYVGSRRLQRTAEPLSGGPSNAEIEERRARATNASNVPTKEIMSSSDSEACLFLDVLRRPSHYFLRVMMNSSNRRYN